jgi:hypothetical protein
VLLSQAALQAVNDQALPTGLLLLHLGKFDLGIAAAPAQLMNIHAQSAKSAGAPVSHHDGCAADEVIKAPIGKGVSFKFDDEAANKSNYCIGTLPDEDANFQDSHNALWVAANSRGVHVYAALHHSQAARLVLLEEPKAQLCLVWFGTTA